jgi:hypothetical protein
VGHLAKFTFENWQLVIEDDDNVAYAYLLMDDQVVSDVWLYNHGDDPVQMPWRDGSEMPFRNPAEFVNNEPFHIPQSIDDFDVAWSTSSSGAEVEAEISIFGIVTAWLTPGAKPGWSARVIRDGPLAKVRL